MQQAIGRVLGLCVFTVGLYLGGWTAIVLTGVSP